MSDTQVNLLIERGESPDCMIGFTAEFAGLIVQGNDREDVIRRAGNALEAFTRIGAERESGDYIAAALLQAGENPLIEIVQIRE